MTKITKERFDLATDRGERARKFGLVATAARFHPDSRSLVVSLANGVTVSLPVDMIEGLHGTRDDEIAHVEIEGGGTGLYWPALDFDTLVLPLIAGITGTEKWLAARLGAMGGASKSEAKADAARRNGRRGGRPKRAA